jgi:hypothetical protein
MSLDYPLDTKWLSADERRLATTRLIIREDLDEKMPYRRAIVIAAKDPKLWVGYSKPKQRLRY